MKLSQILPLVIVGGALATSLVPWEKPAQAIQVFNFSFDNTNGPVNGTVSGTLDLPNGNGTFAATSLKINSAPAALGYTQPVDVFSYFPNVFNNSFTVSSGTITASSFAADNGQPYNSPNFVGFALNYVPGIFGTLLSNNPGVTATSGVQDMFSTTLTYSPATPVPFDTTPGAMLLTIPVLALMYRWKQSRSRIALRTTEKPAVTVS
jgi:hypothetical protein